MKVLITGGRGQLGRAVSREFAGREHEVTSLDLQELDVRDAPAVRAALHALRPQLIVHCAAYTDVDGAETAREEAFLLNADSTAIVGRECQRIGARFVYPSTDYVFPGSGSTPWTPADPVAPLNVYGESKVAGEQAALCDSRALVVRTSWLYNRGGRNFVEAISRRARELGRVDVVDDQIGRPTWAPSLAAVIADLVDRDVSGIFHASDGGLPASWFRFAQEILTLEGISAEVVPVSSGEYPQKARRPSFSVLDCEQTERAIGRPLVDWKVALGRYVAGEIES
jgi:dTDP-4-dehydrorhamnose reductase